MERGTDWGRAPRLIYDHCIIEILVVKRLSIVRGRESLPRNLGGGKGCLCEADGIILQFIECSKREAIEVVVVEAAPPVWVCLARHAIGRACQKGYQERRPLDLVCPCMHI